MTRVGGAPVHLMAMSKSMDKQARLRACWSAQETGSYSTMAPPGEEPMQSGESDPIPDADIVKSGWSRFESGFVCVGGAGIFRHGARPAGACHL